MNYSSMSLSNYYKETICILASPTSCSNSFHNLIMCCLIISLFIFCQVGNYHYLFTFFMWLLTLCSSSMSCFPSWVTFSHNCGDLGYWILPCTEAITSLWSRRFLSYFYNFCHILEMGQLELKKYSKWGCTVSVTLNVENIKNIIYDP